MLTDITLKKNIRTFSVSPENLTGEKGRGGMAESGSASYAARELGQGWKVNPYIVLPAGEKAVLADIKGRAGRAVERAAAALHPAEKRKADNPLEWTRRMNNIRFRAEEIIKDELIFT